MDEPSATTASGPVRAGAELPVSKAFVLQLSRETGPTLQHFSGRIEHLPTGHRLRFQTVEELLAALSRLLRGAAE
jgi:hypothetical protein